MKSEWSQYDSCYGLCLFQIQTQDALEAAVAAGDKDKLQQVLQWDTAQVRFPYTSELVKPI